MASVPKEEDAVRQSSLASTGSGRQSECVASPVFPEELHWEWHLEPRPRQGQGLGASGVVMVPIYRGMVRLQIGVRE